VQDGLIGCLGLTISLGMHHGREAGLAAQVVAIVRELASVKLLAIVEDYDARDAESGNYVAPYGEVVHRHKKVLTLACGFGKRAEDVYPLRGKWERTDDWFHRGGRDTWNGCELLALVAAAYQSHSVLPQTRPIVSGLYSRNG